MLSLQMGAKMNELKCTERKQINIRLEVELHDFLVEYAKQNYKTVTAVVREMIATLYRQSQTKKLADTQ
jgi:predicted HicB family RNase H-like nuclease